jgi:hypothetical protein
MLEHAMTSGILCLVSRELSLTRRRASMPIPAQELCTHHLRPQE